MTSEEKMARRSRFGQLIKSALMKESMSMRKLSSATGIDTATISRIVNGKQPAKLEHLNQFSLHLNLSLEELVAASGFEMNNRKDKLSELLSVLQGMEIETQGITERIRLELQKYERYAETEEGAEMILNKFPAKLAQLRSMGYYIDQLKDFYTQYNGLDVPAATRAVIGSALLYFILSADIIPDYSFPFGYIDDAIAIQLVLERLATMRV